MLSPYFPVWLIAVISPIVAFLNPILNPRPNIKPIALFGLCVAVTTAVIVGTPLDWPDLIQQAIILFGIVAAGYTVTKPVNKLGGRDTAILTALVCAIFIGLSKVYAQEAPIDSLSDPAAFLPASEPISTPVVQTVNVWLQWGFGFLGGVLGRLIPRAFRRGA